MLKTLAVMLLTASHSAFANDEVENTDAPTNNIEETTNVTVVDDFGFIENKDEAINTKDEAILIPSD